VRAAVRLSSLAAAAMTLFAAQLTPVDRGSYAKLIAAHKGKVVLVDFWATWCEPCREELPRLVALAAKQDGNKFVLITISADEPEQEEKAAAFLDREHAPAARYIKRTDDDQAFIDSIDRNWSGALPALFLYDATGKRTGSFIGDSDPDDVETRVTQAVQALSTARSER
jgi:thiol-disulfide isomerase/thioredoxin